MEKRLRELAERAYAESRYTFTDFLDMAQLGVFMAMKQELSYAGPEAFGGIEGAERCMVRFGSEQLCGYEQPFPIEMLLITPVNAKFAEALTHRDFLGSILGLGLERSKIGDLIVQDGECAAFVHEDIAEYIARNLITVRRTNMHVERGADLPENLRPRTQRRSLNVSSSRLDAVIARCFNMPREKAQALIREGRVFVNGLNAVRSGRELHTGDVISVRGSGKFIFAGETGRTRKDRLSVDIDLYI